MTDNLPAKSSSRRIQKGHVRKYSTGKVTLVNPEVKKKKQPIRPQRDLRRRIPLRVHKPSIWETNNKPKIQFIQRKRTIDAPEELWQTIKQKYKEQFNGSLDWINNNLQGAKIIVFDTFKEQLQRILKDGENKGVPIKDLSIQEIEQQAIISVLDILEDEPMDGLFEGQDLQVIHKYGDWSEFPVIDRLVADYDHWTAFRDPAEGLLFKKDSGEIRPDYDTDKWFVFGMESNLDADYLDRKKDEYYKLKKMDPEYIEDQMIFNALKESNLPFLHTQGNGTEIFVPKKYEEKVRKILDEVETKRTEGESKTHRFNE